MISHVLSNRCVNLIVQLTASFFLHADVIAQMSPFQLLRYADEKGLDRTDVLTGSEWNGMIMHSYAIKINMSLENAVRHLSDLFTQPQAIHLNHNELPLTMLHWQYQHTSIFLVIGQVNAGQTVGLLSTLDLSQGKLNEIFPEVNKRRMISDVLPESMLRGLQKEGHQLLFVYRDQQILAGWIGVGTIQRTSTIFRQILKQHAWSPVSATSGCMDEHHHQVIRSIRVGSPQSCSQIMTKNGFTLEINHVDSDSRTLTLFLPTIQDQR